MPNKTKFFEDLFKLEIDKPEEEALQLGKIVKPKNGNVNGFLIRADTMQGGVESSYFWMLRFMRNPGKFGLGLSGDGGTVIKIKDVYKAGEASSYWGNVSQRLQFQQQKATELMISLNKMTKDMFQIIRELRVIDERLEYYEGYNKKDESASVALKSLWVDLVEGGAKNPGSVIGLATQVGFVILPDLFFRIHPKDKDDIDNCIERLRKEAINEKIREVLRRKLFQFIVWKDKTEKEIRNRKKMVLAYLRQYFLEMKLYMNWLRPYLRNIKRLQMENPEGSADIIRSFETSQVELELLGVKYEYTTETAEAYEIDHRFKKHFPCILVKFNFVSLPEMAFQKEYQRGAIHLGRTEIIIQGYIATKEQIEAYKKNKDKEDIELLSSYNASLKTMEEELFTYLKEAGEKFEREEKEEEKKEGVFEPFISVGKFIKDLISKKKDTAKDEPLTKKKEAEEIAAATGYLKTVGPWILYDIYKKSHGMYAP